MSKTLTNPSGVLFSSNFDMDTVIYASSNTYNLSGSTSYTETINSGINQYGRPVGVYSSDGGTTWNDMFSTTSGWTVDNNITIKPTLIVSPQVDSSGNIVYYINAPNTGSFTLQTKIVLLAVDSPGVLPTPVVQSSNHFAYTSSFGGNYRKIVQKGIVTGTNDGAIHTVPTNLGKIPIVNSWSYGDNGTGYVDKIQSCSVDSRWTTNSTGNGYVIAYDDNNIYVQFVASTEYYEYLYRIYQE